MGGGVGGAAAAFRKIEMSISLANFERKSGNC